MCGKAARAATKIGDWPRRVLVIADTDELVRRVGASYRRVAERWNDYLDTLTEEQAEFAIALLGTAAELNREEIERLRRDDEADRTPPGNIGLGSKYLGRAPLAHLARARARRRALTPPR
ncbi:MAG TPA: hypothetical protein VIY28_04990 [Pseudonocardiaceae bacterium]